MSTAFPAGMTPIRWVLAHQIRVVALFSCALLGRTVVRAQQIIVMRRGEAIERGTHAELSACTDSHYAVFMRHQLVHEPSPTPTAD